jgi:hypothetical protein
MEFIKNLLILTFGVIFLIIVFRLITKKQVFFTSFYVKGNKIKNLNLNSNILKALKKSGFLKIKESNNSFSAITYPSIWSFSEIIQIDNNKIDEENVLVTIKSKCFFPLQIFDWGKNKRNCEKFIKNLTL